MSDTQFGRKAPGARELSRVANDFQSDAAALEDAPVSLSAHAALYVVLALLVVAIIWSVLGSVDRIVVAQGKVASRTPMLVMQPFTTSRVLEIAVKPGDHVKKGQVLARFDSSFAQADVSALQQKVALLTAQAERLEAQLNNTVFMAGPDDGSERQTQAQIFAQETNNYNAEISQRDARLAQIDSQIQVDRSAIPGIQRQLAMASKVVKVQEYLQSQKAAAALDVMRAQSSEIDASIRLKNTMGEEQKLVQQRGEAVQERQSFLNKWRGDHNQQLVQIRQELAESQQTLNKANRLDEFTLLTAPVDAVVLQVADRSVGSVMKEAETLVTLVPDGASLYVEANVLSRDISYLGVGDAVRVKLESYPFQRFGTVSGTLTVINPDSTPIKEGDEGSRLVYRVEVQLDENVADLTNRGLRLKPGLVASAEIKTGRRSIASYILNPVLRIRDESMREP